MPKGIKGFQKGHKFGVRFKKGKNNPSYIDGSYCDNPKQYHEKYQQEHKKDRKEYQQKYRQEHREQINKLRRKYERERKRKDPKFHLDGNMATAIWLALKGKKFGASWETLVGYTLEKLMQRLSVNFKKGMSFENYGEWHIDHRKPKSLFKYKTVENKEFKSCWSLVNLQPLWASDNKKKSNHYINMVI